MCARRNRLSATAEEGLLEFVQVSCIISPRVPYTDNTRKLNPEKKLIHLSSGVAHIEQRLDRFEANTGASQPNLEPPSVPKKIKVDVFVNI